MNKFVLRQSFLLFLAAFIWGTAFVAQSVGMEHIGPFTFTATRNFIGSAVLVPVIFLLKKGKKKELVTSVDEKGDKKAYSSLVAGGVCCGIVLFVASNLQQIGMQYTTVGKAGFITAMYIVLVPLLGIFLKKKAGVKVWLSVGIAVSGLYLLCMSEGNFTLKKGDFLVLLCALAFSMHILVIDHFAERVDGVKMACIQFLVCALLSSIGMFLFESPKIEQIIAAGVPIMYAGVFSSGVAFTLQIIAQKGMNPTVASLIMSLESVVSVLAGWVILGEKLSGRELMGCILMFAAIILVQLPETGARKMHGSASETVL